MPLIPLRPLLETVDKYHYAQGAFNVNAVAQAKAAIEVHEMFRSAAILQGADLANGFMGGRTDFQNATLEDKKIGAKNIANAFINTNEIRFHTHFLQLTDNLITCETGHKTKCCAFYTKIH